MTFLRSLRASGRMKASLRASVPRVRILLIFVVMFCLFTSAFVFRPTTGVNSMEYADKVIGQSGFLSNTPGVSGSQISAPLGEAFDASGNLWVADSANNRILEFKAPLTSGETASLVLGQSTLGDSAIGNGAGQLNDPHGIAFDSKGDLWVADTGNNRVVEYQSADSLANGGPATIVIGQTGFGFSVTGTTGVNLNSPEDVAFDPSGNLWVADTLNNRVMEFRQFGFADGESASVVFGQPNFITSTAVTTQNGLNHPGGLAFDASGNLWVSDSLNARFLEFSPLTATGGPAEQVLGQSGYMTSTTGNGQTNLNQNAGLAFDSGGNLWVADYANNRVLEFAFPFSMGESASAVIGQSGYGTSGSATSQSGENAPFGVTFDPSGNLWVSDSANNRLLEYPNPVTVTTTVTSTLTNTVTSTVTSTSTSTATSISTVTSTATSTITSTSVQTSVSTSTLTSTVTSTSTATTTSTVTSISRVISPECGLSDLNPDAGHMTTVFCTSLPPNSSIRYVVTDLSTGQAVASVLLNVQTNSQGGILFNLKTNGNMKGTDSIALFVPASSAAPIASVQFDVSP